MTQAGSGVRRAWVGFSALAFAICGVLLLVQFSGRLGNPSASSSAERASPAPAPAPPPVAAPQLQAARRPLAAGAKAAQCSQS